MNKRNATFDPLISFLLTWRSVGGNGNRPAGKSLDRESTSPAVTLPIHSRSYLSSGNNSTAKQRSIEGQAAQKPNNYSKGNQHQEKERVYQPLEPVHQNDPQVRSIDLNFQSCSRPDINLQNSSTRRSIGCHVRRYSSFRENIFKKVLVGGDGPMVLGEPWPWKF